MKKCSVISTEGVAVVEKSYLLTKISRQARDDTPSIILIENYSTKGKDAVIKKNHSVISTEGVAVVEKSCLLTKIPAYRQAGLDKLEMTCHFVISTEGVAVVEKS